MAHHSAADDAEPDRKRIALTDRSLTMRVADVRVAVVADYVTNLDLFYLYGKERTRARARARRERLLVRERGAGQSTSWRSAGRAPVAPTFRATCASSCT